MGATADSTTQPSDPVKIQPLLLPVCCPRFLKRAGLLSRGDAEPSRRQNHRADADVRLRALANILMPPHDTPGVAGYFVGQQLIPQFPAQTVRELLGYLDRAASVLTLDRQYLDQLLASCSCNPPAIRRTS
jgi:hypothetical protein